MSETNLEKLISIAPTTLALQNNFNDKLVATFFALTIALHGKQLKKAQNYQRRRWKAPYYEP
jgi:hypothetical protein